MNGITQCVSFFYLARSFRGPSMLWHVSVVHSFLWLKNIPLHEYTTFTHPFSNRKTLGYFRILAAENSDAMNIKFTHWLECPFSVLLGNTPRSGITGSCGNSTFSFLRNDRTCPLWLHRITSPLGVCEGSDSSASLPAHVIFWFVF